MLDAQALPNGDAGDRRFQAFVEEDAAGAVFRNSHFLVAVVRDVEQADAYCHARQSLGDPGIHARALPEGELVPVVSEDAGSACISRVNRDAPREQHGDVRTEQVPRNVLQSSGSGGRTAEGLPRCSSPAADAVRDWI